MLNYLKKGLTYSLLITLNKNTAYLAGAIIGDGHITNSTKSKTDHSRDYRVNIELTDKEYLQELIVLIKSLVLTTSSLRCVKERYGKQSSYSFQFRNKALYLFLTDYLGIPAGKKCSSVCIPSLILESPSLSWPFLAGLFDTDGGIRGKTIGYTSASKKLMSGVSNILNKENVIHSVESWVNKRNLVTYYGIRISSASSDSFLKRLPMRNTRKRQNVFSHCGCAGVVKRDRSTV